MQWTRSESRRLNHDVAPVYLLAERFDGRFQRRPFERVFVGINAQEDKTRHRLSARAADSFLSLLDTASTTLPIAP
jgi:hypothetical protein